MFVLLQAFVLLALVSATAAVPIEIGLHGGLSYAAPVAVHTAPVVHAAPVAVHAVAAEPVVCILLYNFY